MRSRCAVPLMSCCAALLALPLGAVLAQDTTRVLRGVVTDSVGHPVPYANVELSGRPRVVADVAGQFRIDAGNTRRFILDVSRIGFRSARVTLPALPDTAVRIVLSPNPQLIKGQIIEAERSLALDLHGFYERMQDHEKGINVGYFVTEEDIDKRHPYRTTQLLETFPTVRIERVSGSGCINLNDPKCYAPLGSNRCPMQVFLDGHRLNSLMQREAPATGIDELIPPGSVMGIEVYTSANRAPPQYQIASVKCGVVLIWTK